MTRLIGGLDRLVAAILSGGRWLLLPVVALLFLQWPLRDLVRSYSREANDLGQWLFALYVAMAFTAATRDHTHLSADTVARMYSERTRARLARWCARFQESFETEIDLDAFASEGRAIAQAVKKELPDWSIVYFDEAAAARSGYRGSPSRYEEEI